MKKLLFVLFCFICILIYSCSNTKDNLGCTNALPSSDSIALIKFADDSIKVTRDSLAFYYEIIDSGSSIKPTGTSALTVTYIAKLMDNFIVDSATNSDLNDYTLNQLILGWRFGLPKIGIGGRIRLLIPSDYAWGCTGYHGVPPNAPVYFDIQLLDVR